MKNKSLKMLIALLLIGAMVFTGLPMKVKAAGAYDTNFLWNKTEELQNEWPLDNTLTKTNAGIGTAGFVYSRYYYDNTGRIVLEFDLSMFPDDPSSLNFGSNFRTFRNQWEHAVFFIDPKLVSKVNEEASFFLMSYPAETFPSPLTPVSLSQATKPPSTDNNIYKLSLDQVYPKMDMRPNSDYMKSKLYLVLNDGVTRDQLNQDYAVELRYTNSKQGGQVYDHKTGADKITLVLGNYYGHVTSLPTYDVSVNNDDVTLKTIAPFQTASMPNTIPNPILPPDMMRTVGQSVIYDNVSGKLIVYYKQAPNHYIYTNAYANNGYFLSSWIGIRQVMDSRIYDALKPDENGNVGYMKMFDLNCAGSGWNVTTDIKPGEFSYTPVSGTVGTYSYMLVPAGFKTEISGKAIVPADQTNNVKNVYLHGHKKEADYVRFIYNVDKNKMDALFEEANSSTLSISTSYITDRPTETTQTEYRMGAGQEIVIPKGARIVFDLPKSSRSVFKAGSENNYERIIGDMTTKRSTTEMNHYGVDPTDFGKAYTITPYFGTEGGFVLTVETGLKVLSEDISLTMFDSLSPETVTMTVVYGMNNTSYTLSKHKVDENRLYTMPNANVRSGIIVNRSANTPHVKEFFTDNATITGHSKYPNALVSIRKVSDNIVFKEAYSSTTSEPFEVGGVTYDNDNAGYAFTFDIPATADLKKDMVLNFSNAAAGYFRSTPSTYRAQAKVTFDQNDGTGNVVGRIVPINKKTYGADGYVANGFVGDNILWLDVSGNAVPDDTAVKYLSDYEGRPITNLASIDYTSRQFYAAPPDRAGYTFLGWSTKQVDSMGAAAFAAMPVLGSVEGWEETTNYRFTNTSPVDESRTVYAVWEKDLDTYHIVLHDNNGGIDNTHTVELPLASITNGNTGELTAYLKKDGNILYDNGFVKNGAYFVGWSESETVSGTTQVHELYTNGSKVRITSEGEFQLQQNEEPAQPVTHTNPWKKIDSNLVNENGVATLHLYAQYKKLITMTATKEWYTDDGDKALYEAHVTNPGNPAPTPDPAPFQNRDVAMVLMRTTEGKTLDPTKYEIVEGFYERGTNGAQWQWAPQEGHDPNGRKYSYLMTEFNAQEPILYTEESIITHFNTHRTWASVYITMVGQSDNLSKYTAISFQDGANRQSYMAVATSNQPGAVSQQYVNSTVDYHFELKNFIVNLLPPIINRIQTNHTQIVIDSPTDGAKYLYLKLSENATPILFGHDTNGWSLHNSNSGANFKISEANGKLTISSKEAPALSFAGRGGEKVYAIFTGDIQSAPNHAQYAWRIIQAYDPLPVLQEVKQEPHIKDENGNINDNVISAKIPTGSYAGANYTLGYMEESVFKEVKDNNNTFVVKPDDAGKLTFHVPAGILNGTTQYVIRGVDPADTFSPTDSNVPLLDLTAPSIDDVTHIDLKSGDLISGSQGKVTATDPNGVTLNYSVKKDNADSVLPEGITFDPATGKFSGKTADVLGENQAGLYIITITAEDIYGNVSTANMNLNLVQKETTADITSITQNSNDADGNAVLTVEGIKNATIKLYSKNDDDTFTEIDVSGVSGRQITSADGKINITVPQTDVKRFKDGKIYVTQQEADKLESNKVDSTEVMNKEDNKKIATGGAIAIDNDPPTPLRLVQPLANTNTLKITNVSANEELPDVKDIDKILLQIGNNVPCWLYRTYHASGEPTGIWNCDQGNSFQETEETVTVIVNPNTGETQTKTVGVLNFTLSGLAKFQEFQVITATYYDYLGNASAPVTITVPPLPRPIAPYDMTAMNDSKDHPTKTVIKGKADPGAEVFVKIGSDTHSVFADELGQFTLKIPKQDVGTVIIVTAKLNNYTETAPTTVENVEADKYEVTAGDIEKPYGEATTAEEILGAVNVGGYPAGEEQPVATIDENTILPDGNTSGNHYIVITVTYPDGSTDKVVVRVIVAANPNAATTGGSIKRPSTRLPRMTSDDLDEPVVESEPTPEVEIVDDEKTTVNKDEKRPVKEGGSWSLVSLIATLLSALIMIVQFIAKSSKTDENGIDFVRNKGYKFVTAIFTIAAAIYFFLTNNIHLSMQFINETTPICAVITLLTIISLVLGLRWKED
ncbi:MAG: hypothetical protein GX245_04540 [Eubacteriaceae bacterium]|nr:hypothetical protein [Eubacteriaceae bacterium]